MELYAIYIAFDFACGAATLLLVLKAIRARKRWGENYDFTGNLTGYLIFGGSGILLPWIIHFSIKWIINRL